MNRYFIFGREYQSGDDYIRCSVGHSVLIAPKVGKTVVDEELSLARCLAFAKRGVLREVTRKEVTENLSISELMQQIVESIRGLTARFYHLHEPAGSQWKVN